MGGRWDEEEHAWRLPAYVTEAELAELALLALDAMDPDERSRYLQRQELDGTDCRDARFTGETYRHRDFLRSLGCRWNPEPNCWQLDGYLGKQAIFGKFQANRVQLTDESDEPSSGVRVSFDYDEEKHERLGRNQGCRCSAAHTCDPCRYACCRKAVWISDELYECEEHGKVMLV